MSQDAEAGLFLGVTVLFTLISEAGVTSFFTWSCSTLQFSSMSVAAVTRILNVAGPAVSRS
eukprot:scaffold154017_cov16-Prasinocladus_malaysianus.AAC.1